jgi:hypothetical protein
MCDEFKDTTDASGTAEIELRGGINASGGRACCVVSSEAVCDGVTIPWSGTGAQIDTRDWLTADLNADCVVDALDYGVFSSDWGFSACRTDYNCDGIVSFPDTTFFMPHFRLRHSCLPPIGVQEPGVPQAVVSGLDQNYPNPFNPLTHIRFSIARAGRVVLRIHDIAGRPVRTLVDGWREPQNYEVRWDGKDDKGNAVSSGVYLFTLEGPGIEETRKLVILR